MIAVLLHEHILPNCHSEERSDEESVVSGVKVLRFTQNDNIAKTFEPNLKKERDIIPLLFCEAIYLGCRPAEINPHRMWLEDWEFWQSCQIPWQWNHP